MRPFWKWVIGITISIILVLGGGLWYLGNHWRPILNEQLHAIVLNSTDSLYRVEYDNLNFNLVTGNASVDNFKLIPDTNVYNTLKLQQKAPDNVYDIKVGKLKIKNFHPKRIYSSRKLNIDEITVDQPEIIILNESKPYNDTISTKDKRSLYEQLSEVLNEVRIDNIALSEVNLTYKNRTNLPERVTKVRNVNINIHDILIDSLAQQDTNRFYNARSVDFTIDNYRLATGDSLYYLDLKNVHFSSSERQISLNELRFTPRYNKADFYKKTNLAIERYQLGFDTIRIRHIDLFKLLNQQKLYAGDVLIKNADVEVYNNTAYPRRKKVPKIGEYPHQQLKKLAFTLNIDSLLLENVGISYVEHNGKTGNTGKVTFDKTAGALYNITNDSAALARNKFMTADISSMFMNNGKLGVHFSFNLDDKLGQFSYKGSLTNMDARTLNPLTKPLALLEVSSGNLQRLSFDVKADEHWARGNVRFYYKDLKVQIMLKDKEGVATKRTVISTLANKFIINDSNPDANEIFHAGPINYRRPVTASFFNFFWKSILEGVKPSVGVSKEREARLMDAAKGAENTVKGVKGFIKGVFRKKDDK